jgi:hypothetical protein
MPFPACPHSITTFQDFMLPSKSQDKGNVLYIYAMGIRAVRVLLGIRSDFFFSAGLLF